MPSLKDIRAQIPELSGLDDDAAVAVIHQAYYPDLELSAVASALGHKAKEPKAEPSSKARRLLGDTGLSLLKGVIGVPEAAVGIADLVTGGEAGRMAEAAGFRPKEARAMLDELMTPEQKAANATVQQADGFTGKLGAALTNPSTIGHTIVESLPSIAAGGVVGRGAMALAPRMGAGMAGAIGEGAMAAGQNAEQVRQDLGSIREDVHPRAPFLQQARQGEATGLPIVDHEDPRRGFLQGPWEFPARQRHRRRCGVENCR